MNSDSDLQPDAALAGARHWNYRAIRFEHGEDSHIAIHEVHYEDGKPVGYAKGPAPVMWFEAEGPSTGLKILDRMREALEKAVLTEADFALPPDTAGYEHDGGPLSAEDLDAIKLDSQDHLPKGTTLRSASLAHLLGEYDCSKHGGEFGLGTSEESLSRDYKVTISERLARDPAFSDALDRELADWNSMPAVGRERFWLPAANRYPLKTLIELRKIALGSGRTRRGTKEAKLASMRRFLRTALARSE